MKDEELFELCKKVYESTGWTDTYLRWVDTEEPWIVNADEWHRNTKGQTDLDVSCLYPLYDSDYLLEKLPVHLKEGTLSSLYELDEDGRPWCWGYHYDDKRVKLANGYYAQGWADTPLKALLNLVINLDKGGVKL